MKSIQIKAPIALLLATGFLMTTACAAVAQPPPDGAPSPGAQAGPAPAGAPAAVRKPMFDTPLEGLPGYTGTMYVTDIPPRAYAARHQHPGYEFNYILKGEVTFMVDGRAPFTLKAGEGTYNPKNRVHAVKSASATEPAQLFAVLIHDTGKPLAVPMP
jgi:quercetin dioxygenase-like cupin family protein